MTRPCNGYTCTSAPACRAHYRIRIVSLFKSASIVSLPAIFQSYIPLLCALAHSQKSNRSDKIVFPDMNKVLPKDPAKGKEKNNNETGDDEEMCRALLRVLFHSFGDALSYQKNINDLRL